MKTNSLIPSNVEEYLIVDSFERRMKKLNFGVDFIWQLISHMRGLSKGPWPTSPSDQGSIKHLYDIGLLNLEPDQAYVYDTVSGPIYIHSLSRSLWKKLAIWKSKSGYCLEIIEE